MATASTTFVVADSNVFRSHNNNIQQQQQQQSSSIAARRRAPAVPALQRPQQPQVSPSSSYHHHHQYRRTNNNNNQQPSLRTLCLFIASHCIALWSTDDDTTTPTPVATDPDYALQFAQFASKVLRATSTEPATALVSLFYMHRLRAMTMTTHTAAWWRSLPPNTVHRVWAAAMMLADAYLNDNAFLCKSWGEVTCLPTVECSSMRRAFLSCIEHNVACEVHEFEAVAALYDAYVAEMIAADAIRRRQSPSNGSIQTPNSQSSPSSSSSVSPSSSLAPPGSHRYSAVHILSPPLSPMQSLGSSPSSSCDVHYMQRTSSSASSSSATPSRRTSHQLPSPSSITLQSLSLNSNSSSSSATKTPSPPAHPPPVAALPPVPHIIHHSYLHPNHYHAKILNPSNINNNYSNAVAAAAIPIPRARSSWALPTNSSSATNNNNNNFGVNINTSPRSPIRVNRYAFYPHSTTSSVTARRGSAADVSMY